MLKNLIENAYLHAQSSTAIKVLMQHQALVIWDNGIGLTDTELTLLTKRFWRKSAQNSGYGLGLSLVKVLLEKNGYRIDFAPSRADHQHNRGLKVRISPVN